MSDNNSPQLTDFILDNEATKKAYVDNFNKKEKEVDRSFGRDLYTNEVPVEFVKKIADKCNPKNKDENKYETKYRFLSETTRGQAKNWDEVIFDKAVTFFLAYKHADQKIVDKTRVLDDLTYKGFKEFIKLYEFFYDNKTNIKNIPKYLGDFKEFVDEKHLEKVEKFELEMLAIENQKAEWFKGVMDSFNQEPNDEKYWDNDSYFKGYQHGTEIFRNLMKTSKEIFSTTPDPVKNEFVDQQRKLVKIINDISKNIETEN